MSAAPSQPIHDSPTVLLATLFAARRSGDEVLARLMLRRLARIGIRVEFAGVMHRCSRRGGAS